MPLSREDEALLADAVVQLLAGEVTLGTLEAMRLVKSLKALKAGDVVTGQRERYVAEGLSRWLERDHQAVELLNRAKRLRAARATG